MKLASPVLCRSLNALFSSKPLRWLFRMPDTGVRASASAFAEWEYAGAASALAQFGAFGEVQGKDILDVGCGFGGKAAWYAAAGAHSVTAVDVDVERVVAGREFSRRRGLHNAVFHVGDATNLAYEASSFDLVVFLDTIEHVRDPAAALREAGRVLRPGGVALLAFPPYNSAWGAHLIPFVAIPWAQLFFSDGTLVGLWQERFAPGITGQDIYTSKRVDQLREARRVEDLWHLNRMSIEQFELLVPDLPLCVVHRDVHALWSLQKLASIRPLKEYIATRYLAVLEKQGAPESQRHVTAVRKSASECIERGNP